MKFSFAGIAILAAAGIVALSSAAQTTTLPTPAQQPATQAAPRNPRPGGQVIFSRSTDENGQTTTQSAQPVAQPATQTVAAPKAQSAPPQVAAPKAPLAPPQVAAEDAERQAVTFTDFDLDVRLRTAEQHIAVRALLTVRNDGKTPLVHIPLEISSSLNWERIRVNGKDVAFPVATLNSDADHTGQLHEAAVALSQPLASGQSLQLDVDYSGAIAASAQRLLVIGTPDDVALHSDWDRISVPFIGLRGFGNVVWYPVSSVPVILGDGARLFDEIGEHKLRLAGARFRLRLTAEFPRGQAPTVALINGHPVTLTVTESGLDQSKEVAGVATADTGGTTLGFEAPSLFVAIRTPHPGANTTVFALPEDETAVEAWTTAATEVTPFLQGWLGQRPRSQLTLLDLPDPQDAPFETGALLATAIRQASPDQLDGFLVHALARARMNSPQSPNSPQPPAWLSEGVATFMVTMWLEKQHGRDQALIALETGRAALALAEPASPGESAGQPLALAISPVYYRIKAAYVLWMLRDLAGDPALSAALRAYDPAQDFAKGASPSYIPSSFEKLLEQGGAPSDGSSSLGRQADSRRDLAWFFADWVNADKGLPDLSIAGVFPTSTSAGNWLVAVNVANNSYAQAEVPVTVRTGYGSGATSVTQRILVPARGKAVQRILIQGKPTEVRVNDGTVPETQASVHVTSLDQPAEGSSSSSQSTPPHP